MFHWIECIVVKSLPLKIVDDPLTQEGMRYKVTTSKVLCKNMILAIANVMIQSIAEKLPDSIAILFDGWTIGSVHYIGISESHYSFVGGQETTNHTMLSTRPLLVGDMHGMTARDHRQHISQFMQSFGKSEDNVICLQPDRRQLQCEQELGKFVEGATHRRYA